MVNKVACFLTCGYTEAGTMQFFLKKINGDFEYKQFLYASPEIESWFIADWENGFNYLYCKTGIVNDVEVNARIFFTHHLRQYIEKEILKDYSSDIEKYGHINGKYVKLSDQLINAIQVDSKEYIKKLTGTNEQYVEQIVNSRCLYYSKKLHGETMLKNILPENVAKACSNYFKNTYQQLKDFSLHV